MQNSRRLRMFSIDNEVLCCSSWSCSNSCLMIVIAFVVGTDVNSADMLVLPQVNSDLAFYEMVGALRS